MPRVFPSQVVTVIDLVFPWAATQADNAGARQAVPMTDSSRVAAVLELYEEISQELIRLEGADYTGLAVGIGAMRNAIDRWTHLGVSGPTPELVYVAGYSNLNPISLVRRALAKCQDQVPAPATAGLAFIRDDQLRESLRIDISAAEQAFSDAGWKAATVLAGSVVEALLLWAVQQERSADVSNAASQLVARGTLTRRSHPAQENWDLHEYTEVAAELGLIKPDTTALVRVARDYRNLIHPGRVQRLGQVCDRGTARAALAAIDAVVRDLT